CGGHRDLRALSSRTVMGRFGPSRGPVRPHLPARIAERPPRHSSRGAAGGRETTPPTRDSFRSLVSSSRRFVAFGS
ncbi:MAG: hypothetical protein AVDCRST_MAG45-159, partial [uncultured Solirubrobacterales bacterium]